MTFKNLEQRMAQSWLDMFPGFIHDENAPVSMKEQKTFYDLMKDLYTLAFNEPEMFVTDLHEDDAYPRRFNRASYGKPDLERNMKKFVKAVNDLLQNMFLAGQGSAVKFNKKQLAILSRLGIENLSELPAAWKWMASRPDSSIIVFSHCFFKKDYLYASDIFADLLGKTAFKKLEKWMTKKGYRPYMSYDLTASKSRFTLTYANPAWSDDAPNGFLFKIKHTGISASYEPYTKNPPALGLCIPNGLKPYLDTFGTMDEKLQSFITEKTKKCDNCRYCVQTDKTGTRPLAAIKVSGGKNLCPYFPGFSYCWSAIDGELADKLISFLSYMDKFAPGN